MKLPLKYRILRALGHVHGLPGRDRVLRAFANPDTHPSFPFEVEYFGQSYSGNLNNFLDWSTFFYGGMGLQEFQLLSDLATALEAKGKTVHFFDIGANIGTHTLYMARHAARIFSFEPFAPVRDEMKRKLAHAGVGNVTVFPVALGAANEVLSYTPPTGSNTGTGTLGSQLPTNAAAHTIQVDVARGDDFFAANHLPPITLLKMDVEGFELKVLEGLRQTLLRDRPPILMENQMEPGETTGGKREGTAQDFLYPDHLVFEVEDTHKKSKRYALKPSRPGSTDLSLVLPRELAGILPGTDAY